MPAPSTEQLRVAEDAERSPLYWKGKSTFVMPDGGLVAVPNFGRGGVLGHKKQWRCPWVKCRVWLRSLADTPPELKEANG